MGSPPVQPLAVTPPRIDADGPALLAGARPAPVTVLHTRVVTAGGGGPEKTILNSPRFLDGHGYRAMCAFMHPPGDPGFEIIRERAAASGAPIASIPDRGFWDLGVARRLLALCRDENVAVWHAHDYKSNALGLVLRRFHPLRLVTTVHGWVKHTKRTPLYYWIDRRCLKRYERVICVSPDLVERCRAAGVPAGRCVHVDNAIDTDQFRRRASREEARARLGFRPDRLLIGGVGRLSDEKGFDLLIEAVARLAAEGHNVQLAIAGDGDQREPLQRLIAAQPEPDRFRLLGHVADTLGFYEALDVFALSSLREGLPNVLLEAMSLELPVVATRVAGVPRLIEDGRDGLLVEPASAEALAAALRVLLADPQRRQQLGRAARSKVEAGFSFAARMDRIRAIYDELLEPPATRV